MFARGRSKIAPTGLQLPFRQRPERRIAQTCRDRRPRLSVTIKYRNRYLLDAFSFDATGPKEKAWRKENAVLRRATRPPSHLGSFLEKSSTKNLKKLHQKLNWTTPIVFSPQNGLRSKKPPEVALCRLGGFPSLKFWEGFGEGIFQNPLRRSFHSLFNPTGTRGWRCRGGSPALLPRSDQGNGR